MNIDFSETHNMRVTRVNATYAKGAWTKGFVVKINGDIVGTMAEVDDGWQYSSETHDGFADSPLNQTYPTRKMMRQALRSYWETIDVLRRENMAMRIAKEEEATLSFFPRLVNKIKCAFKKHERVYWSRERCKAENAIGGVFTPWTCKHCDAEGQLFTWDLCGLTLERNKLRNELQK